MDWRGCWWRGGEGGLESKVTPLLVNVKLLAIPRFSAGFIIIYAEGAVLQRCVTLLQSAASFIKVCFVLKVKILTLKYLPYLFSLQVNLLFYVFHVII